MTAVRAQVALDSGAGAGSLAPRVEGGRRQQVGGWQQDRRGRGVGRQRRGAAESRRRTSCRFLTTVLTARAQWIWCWKHITVVGDAHAVLQNLPHD